MKSRSAIYDRWCQRVHTERCEWLNLCQSHSRAAAVMGYEYVSHGSTLIQHHLQTHHQLLPQPCSCSLCLTECIVDIGSNVADCIFQQSHKHTCPARGAKEQQPDFSAGYWRSRYTSSVLVNQRWRHDLLQSRLDVVYLDIYQCYVYGVHRHRIDKYLDTLIACWLGARKGIRPVKIEWWGVGVVIGLERGADCLHMVQLMPLHPKTPSSPASSKSRLVLPFWYRLGDLPRLSWKRGR